MISFFRKIRKQQLSENKIVKYIFYAFGEIILVVIGILIALSINNWNEDRKKQIKTHTYLSEILTDLGVDTLMFNEYLRTYEKHAEGKRLELMKSDYSNTSTLNLERIASSFYRVGKMTNKTFQKIINTGFDMSILNPDLNNRINEYYTTTQENFRFWAELDFKESQKEIDFWGYGQDKIERKYREIPILQNEEERRANLIRVIKSPQGRTHLIGEVTRQQRFINVLKETKGKTIELIEEIQKEIQKNEK